MRPNRTKRAAKRPEQSRAAVGALLVAALTPGVAWGDPLVTDRPDFTESAETVPRRSHQVEGGYTFAATGGDGEHALGELLLRLPLGARVEARVGAGSYLIVSEPGAADTYGDPSLGVKVKLLDARPGGAPDLAAMVTLIAERAGASAARRLIPELKLLAARDLSSRFALSANLGAAFNEDGASGIASLSLGIDLCPWLGAFAEAFGVGPMRTRDGRSAFVDSGLTWRLHDDLQIDARAGAGRIVVADHDTDDASFIGTGLSYRW